MSEHEWHIRRSPGAVGIIIYCNTHDEARELTVPEAEAILNEHAELKDEIRRHEEVFQFSANKIAALKRENKDMDFLLAKAYDLLEKASGKKDEFGAEAQIWCMQYEDALLTAEEQE